MLSSKESAIMEKAEDARLHEHLDEEDEGVDPKFLCPDCLYELMCNERDSHIEQAQYLKCHEEGVESYLSDEDWAVIMEGEPI